MLFLNIIESDAVKECGLKQAEEGKIIKLLCKHGLNYHIIEFERVKKHEGRNIIIPMHIKYYNNEVNANLLMWKKSSFDETNQCHEEFNCFSIQITKILSNQIDEDLPEFIKFVEFLFTFRYIYIINE